MVKKHTALLAACLLGCAGILAFVSDRVTPMEQADPMDDHPVVDLSIGPRLSPLEQALLRPSRLEPLPPDRIDSETLWLARAIYSETKRPQEQLLVAWVVRNRVETGYRGKRTYRDVILDPYQFSAFLPDNAKRPYYAGLAADSRAPGWQQALRIAYTVRTLDPIYRPFSTDTRHFFSERSMQNGGAPTWARNATPVSLEGPYRVEARRFRFFSGVS